MFRMMMFTRPQQSLVPAIAVVAVVGLAGTALAATVDPEGSNAGQGVAEVEGFGVSDIEYRTDAIAASTTALVDEISVIAFDSLENPNNVG